VASGSVGLDREIEGGYVGLGRPDISFDIYPSGAPEGYISKDIYPILISQSRQKRIFPITFWRKIFWGYNILILGVSKFISYILF
jgi:hypothetical protein